MSALGLGSLIGKAIAKKDAHVVTDKLGNILSNEDASPLDLTKDGAHFFGDMINNLGHSLSSTVNENSINTLYNLINESYKLNQLKIQLMESNYENIIEEKTIFNAWNQFKDKVNNYFKNRQIIQNQFDPKRRQFIKLARLGATTSIITTQPILNSISKSIENNLNTADKIIENNKNLWGYDNYGIAYDAIQNIQNKTLDTITTIKKGIGYKRAFEDFEKGNIKNAVEKALNTAYYHSKPNVMYNKLNTSPKKLMLDFISQPQINNKIPIINKYNKYINKYNNLNKKLNITKRSSDKFFEKTKQKFLEKN